MDESSSGEGTDDTIRTYLRPRDGCQVQVGWQLGRDYHMGTVDASAAI